MVNPCVGCSRRTCSVFECSSGNVRVCGCHRNPDGFFTKRISNAGHRSFSELLAGVGRRMGSC
jgi:hypothetical protein